MIIERVDCSRAVYKTCGCRMVGIVLVISLKLSLDLNAFDELGKYEK